MLCSDCVLIQTPLLLCIHCPDRRGAMASSRQVVVVCFYCICTLLASSGAEPTTADVAYAVTMTHCSVRSDQLHVNGSVVCRGSVVNITLQVLRPFAGLRFDTNISASRRGRSYGAPHSANEDDAGPASSSYAVHSHVDYCRLLSGGLGGGGGSDPLVMLMYWSVRRSPNSHLIGACPVKTVIRIPLVIRARGE